MLKSLCLCCCYPFGMLSEKDTRGVTEIDTRKSLKPFNNLLCSQHPGKDEIIQRPCGQYIQTHGHTAVFCPDRDCGEYMIQVTPSRIDKIVETVRSTTKLSSCPHEAPAALTQASLEPPRDWSSARSKVESTALHVGMRSAMI